MDWKTALVTFALIFFAEIGDKTQLMVMSMSVGSRSPVLVFVGAAAALAASSLIAVLAGEAFLRVVPIRVVRIASAVIFLGLGGAMLLRSMRG